MRGALDSLKQGRYEDSDKTDPKFKSLIPSDLTFEIIEQIIPVMEKILLLSEVLSGDEKPTLHQVIPLIFNLDSFLFSKMRSASQKSFQKDYCSAMSKELNRRYPENGTKVEAYCFSHLLHPFFRGALLNNFEGTWPSTRKAFLEQNEVILIAITAITVYRGYLIVITVKIINRRNWQVFNRCFCFCLGGT